MCISSDAYIAARVLQRLLDRGVSRSRAEAVARKVARRYGDKRNSMYLAYLAGVETGRLGPALRDVSVRPQEPISGQLDVEQVARQDVEHRAGNDL